MALPLIAAGIAARAVVKKLASRAAGGITGAGAKQVTSIYRNSPVSKKMGNPRGVKTNQSGSVTKIPKVTKFQQDTVNSMRTSVANERKSGGFAKNSAVQMQSFNKTLGPKKPTVKINSNPNAASNSIFYR
jgi:hypothetical protein